MMDLKQSGLAERPHMQQRLLSNLCYLLVLQVTQKCQGHRC